MTNIITTRRATRLTRLATPELRASMRGSPTPIDARWAKFDRFLIVGSERGTYFVRTAKVPVDHGEIVRECIVSDGPRVVRRIVEISAIGVARSNGPALFALAMAATLGNAATRTMALEALPEVARSETDWLHFDGYLEVAAGRQAGVVRATTLAPRRPRRPTGSAA